jgi:hypothetical protein
MGQVYYDMGLLSSTEVIECSASDLVGQYVGQTGPKTKKLFEKALGHVLFVDEAYRLSEGPFAKEAVDELVGVMTQERFMGKLVIVLAGYDHDMNRLMAINSGLSSRFPEEIVLQNMNPWSCLEVLNRELKRKGILMAELENPLSSEYKKMRGLIEKLSNLPSWGNARDIKTLSKEMIGLALTHSQPDAELTLPAEHAVDCFAAMLKERRERESNIPDARPLDVMQQMANAHQPPPRARTTQNTKVSCAEPEREQGILDEEMETEPDGRDAGVTDEIWFQLQADLEAEERASQLAKIVQQQLEQALQEASRLEEEQRAATEALEQARAKDLAEQNELKRKREEQRLRECAARAEREKIAAALEAKRQQQALEKQKEAKAQQKLRQMGVCCAGYRWIKQSFGYRCAGGSHFVGNEQLGI